MQLSVWEAASGWGGILFLWLLHENEMLYLQRKSAFVEINLDSCVYWCKSVSVVV